jgi:hypothetical protein
MANMATFGIKEPWMEPMNQFLTSNRPGFKKFVDNICSVPTDRSTMSIPPSYATPITILARLPPTSREGFPSLPYLIDHARNFAALVRLWLDSSQIPVEEVLEGDLRKFHDMCTDLQQRTTEYLQRAEQADRPNSRLSLRWEDIVEQIETSTIFDDSITEQTLALNQYGGGESSNGRDTTESASVASDGKPSFWDHPFGEGSKFQRPYEPESSTSMSPSSKEKKRLRDKDTDKEKEKGEKERDREKEKDRDKDRDREDGKGKLSGLVGNFRWMSRKTGHGSEDER